MNRNAGKHRWAGKKHPWTLLTVRDFLTIVVFLGFVGIHHCSDYRVTAWSYNFHFPRDMRQEHVEAILWSHHLSDPQDNEENEHQRNTSRYDLLSKIKPLYTDMVDACQAHFQPYQNICTDQRMAASKTHISVKDKTPTLTFKLCVLADSTTGYTWNFKKYSGRSLTSPAFTGPSPASRGLAKFSHSTPGVYSITIFLPSCRWLH